MKNAKEVSNICPICENTNFILRDKLKDNAYYTCCACKVVMLLPAPDQKILNDLYNSENYFLNDDHSSGYSSYGSEEAGIVKTFKWRHEKLLKNCKISNVLEIGCGYGFYAQVLKEKNIKTYFGVDMNEHAIYELEKKGFDGVNGTIEGISDKKYFDLVALFDVLEHIPNPHDFLNEIKKRVSEDAFLVFTTPSTSSLLSKISGSRWVSYKIPEHVLLYNNYSLQVLFEEHDISIVKAFSDFQWVSFDFLLERLEGLSFLFRLFRPFKTTLKTALPDFIPAPTGNILVLAQFNSK